MEPETREPQHWTAFLDERQLKEIAFARDYGKYLHGTDGHHRLILIATLANMLDNLQGTPRTDLWAEGMQEGA